MTDTTFVVQNNVNGLLRIVGYFDKIEVAGTNETVLVLHLGFQPVQKAPPMFASKKDEGKLRDAFRLHERDDFKKFVKSAKAPRHEHKAEAVFCETHLAREEIMEM